MRKLVLVLFLLLVNFNTSAQPLLFISEVDGQADIYLARDDNSVQRLTNSKDYELMAAANNEGTRIVFSASPWREGKFDKPQIYLTDFQGKFIRQITDNKKINLSPSFAPDSNNIVFNAIDQNNNSDIFIIDGQGGNLRRMTASPAYEANPSWKINGASVLYQEVSQEQSRIMKMDAGGSNELEKIEPGFAFSPAWGQNGERFVYGLALAGSTKTDLVVADAEGNTVSRLTAKDEIRSHPQLSRDGKQVAFEQNKGNRSGIFISDLTGTKVREVGDAKNHNFSPFWVNLPRLGSPPILSLIINDDAGNILKIDKDNLPEKIVSLSPAVTEIIFALGENKRLKAVTLRANYPAAAKLIPQAGSYNNPDWDKIKLIEPTYVFLSGSLQEKYLAKIKELGFQSVIFKPSNIEEVYSAFIRISYLLTGESKKGDNLAAQVKKDLAIIRKIVEGVKAKKLVYLEINPPPHLYSVGKRSFMNDLMERAGVINVFAARDESYPRLASEDVVSANPEVILIDHPLQFKAGLKKRPGWEKIQAVQDDKVYDAQDFDTLIMDRPGPRVAEAVKIIARLVYPELFRGQ